MRIAAGFLKGRELPRVSSARPVPARLKTSLFSVLAPYLAGARVLDLCAGAGALGFEALSRGAQTVLLLDRDARAVRALRAWIHAAGLAGTATARQADALGGRLPPGAHDVVFLDPPFVFWEEPTAPEAVARAVACLGPEGVAVLKLPGRYELAADPRWRVLRHTRVASVAYVLLGRPPSA